MQATLLGLSTAIILALLAALVGPHFVDWTQYRATFEREATQLAGMPIRIAGQIDVRILPTPTLTLGRVEFGSGETRLIRFIRRRRDAPDLGGDLRGLLEAFGKQPGLFAPHAVHLF